MSADAPRLTEQHISTDRATIRRWADRYNAVPVQGNSEGTLDLVPESEVGAAPLRVIDWDTFYDELGFENHVVLYHEEAGEAPFEVITHEQAVSRSDVEAAQIRDTLVEGDTVTSTVQETTVVETAVIEEATLESELVSREIITEDLLEVELVERACTGCDIVTSGEFIDTESFDHHRYFNSLEGSRDEGTQSIELSHSDSRSRTWVASDNESSIPYTAELDVRETWVASREVTERFTVESRITETNVAGSETIEEYDVDVEGLQQSIVEQGMLDVEHDPEEVMQDFEIESELGAGDQIQTHFTRTSVVEDEVIDRIRAYADIVRADLAEMEFAAADHLVSEEATETMGLAAGRVSLTTADVGKTVVDATGSTIGTVEGITDDGQTALVETHSTVPERIVSTLNPGDEDEQQMEIYAGQFARVTHEQIQLKEHEQLAEHRETNGND